MAEEQSSNLKCGRPPSKQRFKTTEVLDPHTKD